MAEQIWQEDPTHAESFRQDYVDGCKAFIERKNAECKKHRRAFASPKKVAENADLYRDMFMNMLGIEIFRDVYKDINYTRSYVGSDALCDIYRLTVNVLPEIKFYALLLVPKVKTNNSLVIVQHGGGGTPELCCDMYGKNNYNHIARRVLKRGATVIAPQLMLWSNEENETMRAHFVKFDRVAIDNSLKRFGGSITGLEISGIMKLIDYACRNEDIDAEKIAMAGISYGGYFTLYTMAADTRIKAGYCAAVFNDRDVYDFHDWSYFNSANLFQDAEVAGLCAPRRLYVQVGKADDVFDYRSAVSEAEHARDHYAAHAAPENFRFNVWNGAHTIPDDDDGFDFIMSW